MSQKNFQRSIVKGKEIMSQLKNSCHDNYEEESVGLSHDISKICHDII